MADQSTLQVKISSVALNTAAWPYFAQIVDGLASATAEVEHCEQSALLIW